MEVIGKIIQKLPLQSGTSKAGNAWSKQIYVLETIESFPRKVAFDFFGDRINQFDHVCEVGKVVKLSFDIESREYNGRWYTDIRGWKAEEYDSSKDNAVAPVSAEPAAPPVAPTNAPQSVPPPTDMDFTGGMGENDDIPF